VDKSVRNVQRDIVDQQTLHKFKDLEKNKTIRALFERFKEISNDPEGPGKVERLRRKVTHDLEHQIGDLLEMREKISRKIDVEVD
jgi:hypothetical protein